MPSNPPGSEPRSAAASAPAGTLPDPRPLLLRASEQLAALIGTAGPEQLDASTPCTEYDVRGLLAHVVGGSLLMEEVGIHGKGGDEAHPVHGVPDTGWRRAYEDAAGRSRAAWQDDARLDAVVRVPWGEMPGRMALSGCVMETAGHTFDLSTALGHPLELDAGVAEFALTVAHLALPAEGRGEDIPFGPVTRAPEGADAYEELAAWLGREVGPARAG